MHELSNKTKKNIEYIIERKLGITYEEYEKLDFDEQQKLISKYHKERKTKTDNVTVMIGSGEYSIFTKVKKGEKIMIGTGEHSCFVRAGITPEEAREELNQKLDNIIYSKPVAFVKKLQRKFKK